MHCAAYTCMPKCMYSMVTDCPHGISMCEGGPVVVLSSLTSPALSSSIRLIYDARLNVTALPLIGYNNAKCPTNHFNIIDDEIYVVNG